MGAYDWLLISWRGFVHDLKLFCFFFENQREMSRTHSRAMLVDSFSTNEDTVQQRKGTPIIIKSTSRADSAPSTPLPTTPTRAVKSNETTAFLKEELEKQRLKIVELEKELVQQKDKVSKVESRCKSDMERHTQFHEKQIAEKDEQIWKLEEKTKTVDRLRV